MIVRELDKKLVLQPILNLKIKLEVYKGSDYIDSIEFGIISGSSSIDAESEIRRTFNANLLLSKINHIAVGEDNLIWIDKTVKMYIGIQDLLTQEYVWYKQGTYVYTDANMSFNAETNELSTNCSDLVTMLDGTKNGQIGALVTTIPAYSEDEEGNPIEYNIIRNAVITILRQLARIYDYNIDDIGEFKGMPQYNDNYLTYREENPLWNTVPYDLEFSAGDNILTLLTSIRDLYPNYEMFFNEDGTFIAQMIPSCYYDELFLDNNFIQKILISEDTSIDLSSVRNVCEVWGQVIDTEFYTEDCTLNDIAYECTVEGYDEKYYNGDLVAVKVPSSNPINCSLNINGLGNILIYDENTDDVIAENQLQENTIYVFKIKRKIESGGSVFKAYLLGHWQAHGMNVLVDGTKSDEMYTMLSGEQVPKYSKEYFQDVYGCENVEFSIIPDSPFTVQAVGEILDVKTGDEYENITSDSLALARAEYENWKNCRLTDSITITTKICPFADVNVKISYKRSDADEVSQYIVKSISHDWSGGTTTWNLMKFYPLYQEQILSLYTHLYLSEYSHDELDEYTYGMQSNG